MLDRESITFVMTSCNRFDLLGPTLDSFLKFNTYPIEKYIFIEDTDKIEQLTKVIKLFPKVYSKSILLCNDPKLGQIKSIDKAYSFVSTDYIFHCEEDWEFYNNDFIEKSISLLKEDSKIINVWLRELNDTNGHPVEDQLFISRSGLEYKKLITNYKQVWHGFTFNPCVKRMIDYKLVGSYDNVGHESAIGKLYYDDGYYAVIFTKGFLRHSGWYRRVLDSDKDRSKFQIEIDGWFKKHKAQFYKFVGLYGKNK